MGEQSYEKIQLEIKEMLIKISLKYYCLTVRTQIIKSAVGWAVLLLSDVIS